VLQWPLHFLFHINQESIGNLKLVNNTILKANIALYHFQPLLGLLKTYYTTEDDTFSLRYFSGNWLLASCCIFITVSKLHDLMDLWWSEINSFKSKAWTVSFFITSNQPKSKFFRFRSPLSG